MKPTLNLGCGNDKRGTIRIDIHPARSGITLLADAHFIPLRDKAINKTLCKSVLEHVESPVKVILEMKRITIDEIIIIVPNLINVRRIWRTLKNPLYPIRFRGRHLQGWDSKEIRHLAHITGLRVKKINWRSKDPHRFGYVFMPLFASHMTAILKDVGELCKTCGTLKKRLWCEPDFSYCPKCDIDGPECTHTMA